MESITREHVAFCRKHAVLVMLMASFVAPPAQLQTDAETPKPQGEIRSATRAGVWDFPGGATITVTQDVFHGADVATRATIRWPQRRSRKAMHHTVHVASDAFGAREPWIVLWESKTPVLWVIQGPMIGPGQRRDSVRPVVAALRRVDLSDHDAIRIRHVTGIGPEGFAPRAITEQLRETFDVPDPDGRPLPEPSVVAAARDVPFELLYRVRVEDPSGEPLAAIPVRFSAVIPPGPPGLHGHTKKPADVPVTFAANNGIEPVRSVSMADGVVWALVPLAEFARDHGAIVYATPERGAAGSARQRRAQKIAPLRLSPGAIRDLVPMPSESTGVLRGRLIRSDGSPVPDTHVAVAPRSSPDGPLPSRIALTRADGTFVIRELPVGTSLQLLAVVDHRSVCLAGDGLTASADGPPVTLVLERHAEHDRQVLRRRD